MSLSERVSFFLTDYLFTRFLFCVMGHVHKLRNGTKRMMMMMMIIIIGVVVVVIKNEAKAPRIGLKQ